MLKTHQYYINRYKILSQHFHDGTEIGDTIASLLESYYRLDKINDRWNSITVLGIAESLIQDVIDIAIFDNDYRTYNAIDKEVFDLFELEKYTEEKFNEFCEE